MRLARRLALGIAAGVFLVLLANAALRIRREIDLFDREARRDARLLAEVLADAIGRAWHVEGEKKALEAVDGIRKDVHRIRIRWVWLDAPAGDPCALLGPKEGLEPLAQGRIVVREETRGPETFLCTYAPLSWPTGRPGALEIADSHAERRAYVKETLLRTLYVYAILAVAVIAISILIGYLLVGRRVRRLVEKARRIGAGDFGFPIVDRGRDELGFLASEVNAMADRIRGAAERLEVETQSRQATLESLRQADRLSTIGTIASGVAHELGTPLNVVSAHARMIERGETPASDAPRSAKIIAEQADRMAGVIRGLLTFARSKPEARETRDLRPVVSESCDLISPLAKRRNIRIEKVIGDEPQRALVDVPRLQQAFVNLLINGIQAMAKGGRIEVRVETVEIRRLMTADRATGLWRRVSVRDEGGGVAPEVRAKMFDPFFTTKPPGEGTGLGLWISTGIVRDHGGWIDVESEPGKGAVFSIFLPAE